MATRPPPAPPRVTLVELVGLLRPPRRQTESDDFGRVPGRLRLQLVPARLRRAQRCSCSRFFSAFRPFAAPKPTAATGPTRAATATREGPGGGGATGMCAVIFLFLFLCFHLFFISLFFFSDHFFSDKYNNRRGTKGKRRRDGTGMYAGGDSNVGRHGGGRRGQRVRLLLFFCPFYSPLLFSSFFFFSDCLFFSGV